MLGLAHVAMAASGYAFMEGYRYIKKEKDEEGKDKETVMLMFGPFSEPFKAWGRIEQGFKSGGVMKAMHRVFYNKLAALPHIAASIVRNRDWKGDPIAVPGAPDEVNRKRFFNFLVQEMWPIAEQVESWSEEEQETIDNVLRLAAISRYSQKPKRDYLKRKLSTRLGQLRKWAKDEARKNPEMTAHFLRRAKEVYVEYANQISEEIETREAKLKAIQEGDIFERIMVQFGLKEIEAPPEIRLEAAKMRIKARGKSIRTGR
jgi:hypothetical protein